AGRLVVEGGAAGAGRRPGAAALLASHFFDLVGVLPLVSVFVVLLAVLGIAQHFVSRGDFLEARLGRRVVGVHVGVVLPREFAVGSTDFLIGSGARDTENLIEVFR